MTVAHQPTSSLTWITLEEMPCVVQMPHKHLFRSKHSNWKRVVPSGLQLPKCSTTTSMMTSGLCVFYILRIFDFTCLERISAHKKEIQLLTLLVFQYQFDPAFTIYHDGPATAYMSKAPGELNDYTGDGDWSVSLDLS